MYRVSLLGQPLSDDRHFDILQEAIDYALEMSRKIDLGYSVTKGDNAFDVHIIAFGGMLFEDGAGIE
jgi:hypothetical protein